MLERESVCVYQSRLNKLIMVQCVSFILCFIICLSACEFEFELQCRENNFYGHNAATITIKKTT